MKKVKYLTRLRVKIIDELMPFFTKEVIILNDGIDLMQYHGDGLRYYKMVSIDDLKDLCYDSLCALHDNLTKTP